MIIIKFWHLLCTDQDGEKLRKIEFETITAARKALKLRPNSPTKIACFFPVDHKSCDRLHGYGEKIIVEITNIPDRRVCTQRILDKLATVVGQTVANVYPHADVVCIVDLENAHNSHWESKVG